MKPRPRKPRLIKPLPPGEPAHSLTHFPFYPTPITPEMLERMADTESQMLILHPSSEVNRRLQALVKTGLWGRHPAEVAERLLCDRLRQPDLAHAGFVPQSLNG